VIILNHHPLDIIEEESSIGTKIAMILTVQVHNQMLFQ